VERLSQNIRYGLRSLARSPSFTVIAVLTLGLGIGINASVFSLISAMLLRQPPVHDPNRVVVVVATNSAHGEERGALTVADFLAWREQANSFTGMVAVNNSREFTLTGEEHPERLAVSQVSTDYFSLLGVTPMLGRTFSSVESQPGQAHTIVLSQNLWRRRFKLNGNIIGKTIALNGDQYTVAGVMPSEFEEASYPVDAWIPLVLPGEQSQQTTDAPRDLMVYARLKPGILLARAQAEMKALAARSSTADVNSEKGWSASVISLRDYFVAAGTRNALLMLMGVVGFVLLIACANIANLLTARSAGREKEFSIRTALGASRWRLTQQLLIENLLVALAGGVFGLMLAFAGVRFLRVGLGFNSYGAWFATKIRVDANVLAFTFSLSLLTVFLFGLIPALQSSAADPNVALKEESRTGSTGIKSRRLRSSLVASQIALALILLTGSGLMIQGLNQIMKSNMGFDMRQVLTTQLEISNTKHKKAPQQVAFVEAIAEHIANLPGVRSAAATTDLPASQPRTTSFNVEGQPTKPEDRAQARYFAVSPGYLQVMRIELLRGRGLSPADRASTPGVALVNQVLAQRFFAKGDAIGKRLAVGGNSTSTPSMVEIVGVVGNVTDYPGEVHAEPQIYVPYAQSPSALVTIVARTNGDPISIASSVRESIWSIDPDQSLSDCKSLKRVVQEAEGGNALMETLLAIFAVLALVLAAIGIYGVIEYTTFERTREIGIRLALGASRRQIIELVFKKTVFLAALGSSFGFLASLILPRLLANSFQGLTIHPVPVFVGTTLSIVFVSMLSTCIPAQRASKIDPSLVLR
jgi:putative ABC transport system permease protein